ncbi:MAG: 4Fe-4S dicluster domain-containing protein [Desulfobacterales bacterium]
MAGKFFLIDTTRCTACRGCQIACKAWNELPADKTKQYGSYQNPLDLNGNTYRLVRFAEYPSPKNSMVWYFFSDACRHCLAPPCKKKADQILKDAIVVNEFGAVLYTEKTKELERASKAIKQACPWSVPNWSKDQKQLVKCHMCHDRVAAGLLPACVKACSTGALNFGDEADIKKLAKERLAEAKKKFGAKAHIEDEKDVRSLFLIVDDFIKYKPMEM